MRNSLSGRLGALLALFFGLTLLAGCQPPERGQMPGPAVDTAAVKATVDSLREAYLTSYNAGEAERVAALYAADAVFLPADAPPVSGRDSIRSFLERELAPGPTLEVTSHEVKALSPDWASSGGAYRLTVTPQEAQGRVVTEGSYLVLFRRTPDGWKLFRHAATLDSLPATGGE